MKMRWRVKHLLMAITIASVLLVVNMHASGLLQHAVILLPAIFLVYAYCRAREHRTITTFALLALTSFSSICLPLRTGHWRPGDSWVGLLEMDANVQMLVAVPLLIAACIFAIGWFMPLSKTRVRKGDSHPKREG